MQKKNWTGWAHLGAEVTDLKPTKARRMEEAEVFEHAAMGEASPPERPLDIELFGPALAAERDRGTSP